MIAIQLSSLGPLMEHICYKSRNDTNAADGWLYFQRIGGGASALLAAAEFLKADDYQCLLMEL